MKQQIREHYLTQMGLRLEVREVFRFWKLVITERKFWITFGVVAIGSILSIVAWFWGFAALVKGGTGSSYLVLMGFSGVLLIITFLVSSLLFSLIAFLIRDQGGNFQEEYPKVPFGAIFGRFPVVIGMFLASFLVLSLLTGIGTVGLGLYEEGSPAGIGVLGGLLIYLLLFYFYIVYGKIGGSLSSDSFGRAFKEFLSSLWDFRYFRRSLNSHYFLNMSAVFGVLILGTLVVLILENLLIRGLFTLNPNIPLFLFLLQYLIDLLFTQLISALVVVGATFAHLSVDPPFNPLRG